MKTISKNVKRRALSEIQSSAPKSQQLLVGSHGIMCVDKKKGDRKRKINVDLENGVCSSRVSKDRDDGPHVLPEEAPRGHASSTEAYDLMVKDEAPPQYWKELAEQRRVALEKALQENEELHEQLELLTAENKHLQTIADQTLPLAELLKDLTGETLDVLAEAK